MSLSVSFLETLELLMNKQEFSLHINCSGCEVELTTKNLGTYPGYCGECVSVMPPRPVADGEYKIAGDNKNYYWVSVIENNDRYI